MRPIRGRHRTPPLRRPATGRRGAPTCRDPLGRMVARRHDAPPGRIGVVGAVLPVVCQLICRVTSRIERPCRHQPRADVGEAGPLPLSGGYARLLMPGRLMEPPRRPSAYPQRLGGKGTSARHRWWDNRRQIARDATTSVHPHAGRFPTRQRARGAQGRAVAEEESGDPQ